MDIYLSVDADKVEHKNGRKNTAHITVDLSRIWTDIYSRYTHIHVELQVYIPIVTKRNIVIEMSEDFDVSQIQNYKVEFEASYSPDEEDGSTPFGSAQVWGYQIVGGSGT